jgi:hypothetical protein
MAVEWTKGDPRVCMAVDDLDSVIRASTIENHNLGETRERIQCAPDVLPRYMYG